VKDLHASQLGALWAALGVALGAFGAHTLSEWVTPERLATFETGVRYQLVHALGLVVLGALPDRAQRAAPLLFAGSFVFSGSLYALVLLNMPSMGAVTPLGGALQVAGWGYLAWLLGRKE
jgi:uncharacterized membrane protein YgdD (TMEM256/DUF423 family)